MGKEIIKIQKTNVMHHEITAENSEVNLTRDALQFSGDQSLEKRNKEKI